MTKAIIYYTANMANPKITAKTGGLLRDISRQRRIPIVCASLNQPLQFGDINACLFLDRSPLSQFRQILCALSCTAADIVYFCEDDILYHPSHFDFVPSTDDAYYYNTNIWKLWIKDGLATREGLYMPLSGLCGYHSLLFGHYFRRVQKILQNQRDTLAVGGVVEREGYSKHMGYEPGGHMKPRGVDEYPMVSWQSEVPIIDVRHDNNLTKGKRRPGDYRDPVWADGWEESDSIPGWGGATNIISELV